MGLHFILFIVLSLVVGGGGGGCCFLFVGILDLVLIIGQKRERKLNLLPVQIAWQDFVVQ